MLGFDRGCKPAAVTMLRSKPHRRPLLPLLTAAILSAGLVHASGCGTRGSGNPTTESREIGAFERVEVSGAFDVMIHVDPAAAPKLTLTADDNLLDHIEVHHSGVELDIGLSSRRGPGWEFINIRPKTPMRVEIWTPSLAAVELSGATELEVEGLHGERFELDASGASDATLRGAVDRLELDLSGAGDIHARALEAEQVEVRMSGAAEAEVSARERLDVDISGAGEVTYYGKPAQVHQDISGAGSLKDGG